MKPAPKLTATKQPSVHALPEPTEAEIQEIAHQLWLEAGCPVGCDLDHWFAAKELLRHRHGRAGGRGRNTPPVPLHFPPGEGMQPSGAAVA